MAAKLVFAYRITIVNTSSDVVQLLRRHWLIKDSNQPPREVEGEGVIGKQPILQPGEEHQYMSYCQLQSDIGKMEGTYLMLNKTKGTTFRANIPAFELIPPFKLN